MCVRKSAEQWAEQWATDKLQEATNSARTTKRFRAANCLVNTTATTR